ncbi:UNVERIFIED_CONTAM: hypothetical protein GTU68_008412 [Idotea baltica]|nr:hypothetical protein [Idotea baltica]
MPAKHRLTALTEPNTNLSSLSEKPLMLLLKSTLKSLQKVAVKLKKVWW